MRAPIRLAVPALSLVVAAALAAPAAAQEPSNRELLQEIRALRAHVGRLEQRVEELEGGADERGVALEEAVADLRAGIDAGEVTLRAGDEDGFWSGVEVSGFLEFLYSENLSDTVGAGRNDFRGPDREADTFSLQVAQIVLERPARDIDTSGFYVKAEYGRLAELIDADPKFDGGSSNAFSVSEAYVTYRSRGPFGFAADWQVGRFQSPLGYESNENTANLMVTRNPIYQLATPTTHLGVRGLIPLEALDAEMAVYLVNGWDNLIDDDGGTTGIVSYSKPLGGGLALTINASHGHEGSLSGDQGDKTSFGEVALEWMARDDVLLVLDTIAARTEDALRSPGRVRDRRWRGAALYGSHDVTETTAVNARVGYYTDDAGPTVGRRLRLMDASLAMRHRLTDGLSVLVELRRDWSPNGRPFARATGRPDDEQDTITFSLVHEF